jgi:hypothetical protein
MFFDQFVYQWPELHELACSGKQHPLLSSEVKLDFLFEIERDFRMPWPWIDGTRVQRPFDPDAQCEGVLMLMRKRDQIAVAKHTDIMLHPEWAVPPLLNPLRPSQ